MWIKRPTRPNQAPDKIGGYAYLVTPSKWTRFMLSYYVLPGFVIGLLVAFVFYETC